jgi:hypothetical protein
MSQFTAFREITGERRTGRGRKGEEKRKRENSMRSWMMHPPRVSELTHARWFATWHECP